jgi:hypothetical protein
MRPVSPLAQRISMLMFCPSIQPSFSRLLAQRANVSLCLRVALRAERKQCDPANPFGLLRACHERPRRSRAAEKGMNSRRFIR